MAVECRVANGSGERHHSQLIINFLCKKTCCALRSRTGSTSATGGQPRYHHSLNKDAEFLITNKFGYIVNCTAELGNHFEDVQGIHYLKLKYERTKPHRLWGDTFKKLHRFYTFIEEADEQAECCLVYSNLGNNRCCAVVIAYLMKRFLWTFEKTLNYVKSKRVEMKLSASYVQQLKALELYLQQEQPLSNDWRRPYLSEE